MQERLPEPLPCTGCGMPADFAWDDGVGEVLPWHDVCAARMDRLVRAVFEARDRRLASGR